MAPLGSKLQDRVKVVVYFVGASPHAMLTVPTLLQATRNAIWAPKIGCPDRMLLACKGVALAPSPQRETHTKFTFHAFLCARESAQLVPYRWGISASFS